MKINLESIITGENRGIRIYLTKEASLDLSELEMVDLDTLKSVSIDKSLGFSVLQVELNESPYTFRIPLIGITNIKTYFYKIIDGDKELILDN